MASEKTAMEVSFQCFLRIRRENRMLDQSAMLPSVKRLHKVEPFFCQMQGRGLELPQPSLNRSDDQSPFRMG